MIKKKVEDLIDSGKLDESLLIIKTMKEKNDFMNEIVSKGRDFVYSGDLDKASDLLTKCLYISEKLGDQNLIVLCYSFIAFSFAGKGELDRAFIELDKAYKIGIGLDDKRDLSSTHSIYGYTYYLRGDLDASLDHFKKSFKYAELTEDTYKSQLGISFYYYNVGKILKMKNEWQSALEHFEKGLTTFRKINNEFGISISIFQQILLYLDKNEIKKAIELSPLFDQLDIVNNKMVKLRKTLANALILKNRRRAMYKTDAQRILQEIINGEIIDHEMTIISMISLTEILLDEWKTYNEEEVLYEIEEILEKLSGVAQNYRSNNFLVETLILKSRLSLISGKINQANELLKQANFYAKERKLEIFSVRIENEQKLLEENIKKWESLSKSSSPISRKIKENEIQEYISFALEKLEHFKNII
jgi:tetratricopeptide (TPR) repeat protein